MSRPDADRQLVLPLVHDPQLTRADFLVGPANAEAMRLIDLWPAWPQPLMVLTGAEGTGKTHLAHIFAERAGARLFAARDLADDLAGVAPTELARTPLAIEDADGDGVPLTALFHLINAVRSAGSSMLVTMRRQPEAWAGPLPDLLSRLRAGLRAGLGAPDDDLIARLTVKLFADRQTTVDAAVVAYLVPRMERSFAAAGRLVARMDELALARHIAPGRGIAADALLQLQESDLFG